MKRRLYSKIIAMDDIIDRIKNMKFEGLTEQERRLLRNLREVIYSKDIPILPSYYDDSEVDFSASEISDEPVLSEESGEETVDSELEESEESTLDESSEEECVNTESISDSSAEECDSDEECVSTESDSD